MQAQLMLGNAYAAAGKNTDAEPMLESVRARMEEVWGWNHVATMACTKSLVLVFEILEKYDKVQELYDTAIKGARQALGREYPWTLELMNNWACFSVRRADFHKARELLNDVYEAKKHVLGQNHRTTIDTLCNLSQVALDQDEYKGIMESAVESLRDDHGDGNINVMGPKWGHGSLLGLEWVRNFVRKWTGMDVQTFTEYLSSDVLAEWSGFVNPKVLLEEACAAGYEPAVQMLLEKYGKVDDWKGEVKPDLQTAFRKGVVSGSEPVVQLLLDYDVEINEPDNDTMKTALHDAAELGYESITSLLLDIGADDYSFDGCGNVAMDLSMKAGHEGVPPEGQHIHPVPNTNVQKESSSRVLKQQWFTSIPKTFLATFASTGQPRTTDIESSMYQWKILCGTKMVYSMKCWRTELATNTTQKQTLGGYTFLPIASILDRLKQKYRAPVTSVFDLAELIMARCLGLNFDKIEWEYERHRYLEIFDYSINYVANEEARCFNDFADRAKKKDRENGDKAKKRRQGLEKEGQKTPKKKPKKNKKEENQAVKHRDARVIVEDLRREANDTMNRGIRGVVDDFSRFMVPALRPDKAEDSTPIVLQQDNTVGVRSTSRVEASTGDDLLANRTSEENSKTSLDPKKVHREEESFDISHEVELLREIKDIRDELNMLSNLFGQQKLILEPFTHIIAEARQSAAVSAGDATDKSSSKPSLVGAVERHIAYVEQMDDSAGRLYRHLEDLLDLKQKQANVYEARTMRVSGNTITVFTIVTIIFLPASFMAAFLALPISEYPSVDNDKMQLGYAIKYTGAKDSKSKISRTKPR
ncbi:hypothetical protein CkaCkLH20_08570 [Colletotrichum karsti]|uniref:Ankyrin repeat protein n=1 Tax=Colletotrichum karsti TaxID=1095194 RepID=A0A9P6I2N5_9PEZI|nr:uncharacterized protein CkaCkLH20_08570 [Colletotrichum karsti]KAF9873836.1 hypothetical protein CkaCkLH20_08570 [Colletotrichum karsti]